MNKRENAAHPGSVENRLKRKILRVFGILQFVGAAVYGLCAIVTGLGSTDSGVAATVGGDIGTAILLFTVNAVFCVVVGNLFFRAAKDGTKSSVLIVLIVLSLILNALPLFNRGNGFQWGPFVDGTVDVFALLILFQLRKADRAGDDTAGASQAGTDTMG